MLSPDKRGVRRCWLVMLGLHLHGVSGMEADPWLGRL
jgi:hypothetical protein